jgi:hypothetical protein
MTRLTPVLLLLISFFGLIGCSNSNRDPVTEVGEAVSTRNDDDEASKSANHEFATFALGDVKYRVRVPDGLRIPSGKVKERLDSIPSNDSRNMTHLWLVQRDELANMSDVNNRAVLIKTPMNTIGKKNPLRQDLIADVKKGIKRHNLVKVLNDLMDDNNKSYTDVFGEESHFGGHLECVDADNCAAYFVGTLGGDQRPNVITAVAGAITVVRGNVFFYYRYKVYDKVVDVADALKDVRKEIRWFLDDNRQN